MSERRLLGLLIVMSLGGCQRSVAVRATAPMRGTAPTGIVEVVRNPEPPRAGKNAGKTVNGLALELDSQQDKLSAGQQAHFTLTLHNRSDKTFQVALHDQGCCLSSDLRFIPDLDLARGGHTVEPNFYPGGVHLIFGGGQIALKFRLERTADGKSLFLPTQAHQGQSCGNLFTVPQDLKKLEVQFRLYASDQLGWSNLKYTEPAWSGECFSNAVTLQLP